MSTMILVSIKIKPINKIDPITTGRSFISSASMVSFPNPLQLKIYSTKKAPARSDANHPLIAVITGFNALGKACLMRIDDWLSPFYLAVLIKSLLSVSNIELLVSSVKIERGLTPRAIAGRIIFFH